MPTTDVHEYDRAQLTGKVDAYTRQYANPAYGVALRRLLRNLPEGPHTPGELMFHVTLLDMSDLADSTQANYRTAMRTFVRRLRAGDV